MSSFSRPVAQPPTSRSDWTHTYRTGASAGARPAGFLPGPAELISRRRTASPRPPGRLANSSVLARTTEGPGEVPRAPHGLDRRRPPTRGSWRLVECASEVQLEARGGGAQRELLGAHGDRPAIVGEVGDARVGVVWL